MGACLHAMLLRASCAPGWADSAELGEVSGVPARASDEIPLRSKAREKTLVTDILG